MKPRKGGKRRPNKSSSIKKGEEKEKLVNAPDVEKKNHVNQNCTHESQEQCNVFNNDDNDDAGKLEIENHKVLRSGRVVVHNQIITKNRKQSNKRIIAQAQGVHKASIENENQKYAKNDEDEQKVNVTSSIASNLRTSEHQRFVYQLENPDTLQLPPTNEQELQDESSMETEDLEFIIINSETKGKTGNEDAKMLTDVIQTSTSQTDDAEACKQQTEGLDGNLGIENSKEFNKNNSFLNQRPSKEINVSNGIAEKKKSKSNPVKMANDNSINSCEKVASASKNQPLLHKTELISGKNKLTLLNTNQFLNAITSQAMRRRLNDEKLELPIQILRKGTLFTDFMEMVRNSEVENLQPSSQIFSQQDFEEAIADAKIDFVRGALQKRNCAFDLNRNVGDGKTILHHLAALSCSITHSYCDLIDLLVCHGARIDIYDEQGRLPLQIAIENHRLCHVRKLIELRSPINFKSRGCILPLISAMDQYQNTSSDDSLSAVQSILVAGANFQAGFKELPSQSRHNPRQKQLYRILSCHQNKLQGALDLARKTVFQHTATVRALTWPFICPLYEHSEIWHKFSLNYDSAITGRTYCHLIFITVVDFLPDKMQARMWGPCPVQFVKLNEAHCQLLSSRNKFIYLCNAQHSADNRLFIKIDPSFKKSQLKIVVQLALVQLLTPRNYYQEAHYEYMNIDH